MSERMEHRIRFASRLQRLNRLIYFWRWFINNIWRTKRWRYLKGGPLNSVERNSINFKERQMEKTCLLWPYYFFILFAKIVSQCSIECISDDIILRSRCLSCVVKVVIDFNVIFSRSIGYDRQFREFCLSVFFNDERFFNYVNIFGIKLIPRESERSFLDVLLRKTVSF